MLGSQLSHLQGLKQRVTVGCASSAGATESRTTQGLRQTGSAVAGSCMQCAGRCRTWRSCWLCVLSAALCTTQDMTVVGALALSGLDCTVLPGPTLVVQVTSTATMRATQSASISICFASYSSRSFCAGHKAAGASKIGAQSVQLGAQAGCRVHVGGHSISAWVLDHAADSCRSAQPSC